MAHGYKQIQNVLTRPWWVVEQLVAQELKISADQIWPSRYAPGVNRDHAKALTRNRVALQSVEGRRRQAKRTGKAAA